MFRMLVNVHSCLAVVVTSFSVIEAAVPLLWKHVYYATRSSALLAKLHSFNVPIVETSTVAHVRLIIGCAAFVENGAAPGAKIYLSVTCVKQEGCVTIAVPHRRNALALTGV